MDVGSDESGEFVRILARGRNSNRPRPIVVQMREFVGETLNVVGLQTFREMWNIVRNQKLKNP